MRPVLAQYLTWLAATNHSPATIRNRRSCLDRLVQWSEREGWTSPADLTLDVLEAYRLSLYQTRRRDGHPLAWGTQAEYLGAVKAFLAWCVGRGLLLGTPATQLSLPKRPLQLPHTVLSAAEVEAVLRQPDRRCPVGLRDRALLEVFYSTGIRRAELAALRVGDVDPARGVLVVRAGKGQRDRVVPLGARAIRWIERYQRRGRPRLVRAPDPGLLFLTRRGRGLRLNRLSERVRQYVVAADVGKSGSCHIFRHSMATLLLEGGADVRDVQEILGHANLSTTARYTHVSIARLQAVHARAHPAERPKPR